MIETLTIFLLVVLAGLYLLSTPYVSSALLLKLESYRAFEPNDGDDGAGAIVILPADYVEYTPEYGRQTVGPLSLERMRYGVWLHRQTGLPILVAGGKRTGAKLTFAEACRALLADEFAVPVRWIESESMNTFEHAQKIPPVLAADGVIKIILVTHAWHMPRAVEAFEHFGLAVVAAPTRLTQTPTPILADFRPGPRWLSESFFAIYEWAARIWYRLHKFKTAAPSVQSMMGQSLPVPESGSAIASLAEPVAPARQRSAS